MNLRFRKFRDKMLNHLSNSDKQEIIAKSMPQIEQAVTKEYNDASADKRRQMLLDLDMRFRIAKQITISNYCYKKNHQKCQLYEMPNCTCECHTNTSMVV